MQIKQKKTFYAAVALVLGVVIAVALLIRGKEPAVTSIPDLSPAPANVPARTKAPAVSRLNRTKTKKDPAENIAAATSVDPESLAAATAAAEKMEVGDVVGRSFPASESVALQQCKPKNLEAAACEVTYVASQLSLFAQEPRDSKWARDMEARLHTLVKTKPGFMVHRIECRQSLCVAEVASTKAQFLFVNGVDSAPVLQDYLVPLDGEVGLEKDSKTGEQVTVSIGVFKRKS